MRCARSSRRGSRAPAAPCPASAAWRITPIRPTTSTSPRSATGRPRSSRARRSSTRARRPRCSRRACPSSTSASRRMLEVVQGGAGRAVERLHPGVLVPRRLSRVGSRGAAHRGDQGRAGRRERADADRRRAAVAYAAPQVEFPCGNAKASTYRLNRRVQAYTRSICLQVQLWSNRRPRRLQKTLRLLDTSRCYADIVVGF